MNRLVRRRSKRIIAGVCAGLGDYFGIDPALVRLVFVLWAILGQWAVAVYILLWVLIPEEGKEEADRGTTVRDNVREVVEEVQQFGSDVGAMLRGEQTEASSQRIILLGAILVLLGLAMLANNLGLFAWFQLGRLWPLLLIIAGVVLLIRSLGRKSL
ncbi:MAG: PspC domain-containing protein [Chloroflexi bacterium]|nr:PspC domain-containing protein [Chloroflexota bacterium]